MDRRKSSGGDRRQRGGGGDAINAQGILDRFTSVDNLIEETNDTLADVAQTQVAIAELLAEMSDTELSLPSRNELPLYSDAIVAAGESETDEVEMPKDGKLTKVWLTFPQGSNQSIGIGIEGVDGESLIPYGPSGYNFIALDGTSIDFDLDYRVQKGETLTVKYVNNRNPDNGDDLEAFPSAILIVTEGL